MARYKLLIEYDGTPFCGWQRQDGVDSVQGILEQAVQGLCNCPVTLFAAGRTDAGVHATGQVAHFDIEKDFHPDRVRDGINFYLQGQPVSVLMADRVSDDFHARFSAVGRRYLYRIINRRPRLALDENRAWRVPVALDVAAMRAGAAHLLGRHDFTSFRAKECQSKSPIKTLDVLEITQDGDEIRLRVEAKSFLHHQVRNMVGTLKLVGEGKWSPDRVKTALEAKHRAAAGPTCPPHGLYLTGVEY